MTGKTTCIDLGLCRRPVHLKWYHTKQQSHTIEFSLLSIIGQSHRPQYHMVSLFFNSTTSYRAIHASQIKYFRQLMMHSFSSRQDAGTFSSLISTWSLIIVPASAASATAGSMNHSNITKQYNTLLDYINWLLYGDPRFQKLDDGNLVDSWGHIL